MHQWFMVFLVQGRASPFHQPTLFCNLEWQERTLLGCRWIPEEADCDNLKHQVGALLFRASGWQAPAPPLPPCTQLLLQSLDPLVQPFDPLHQNEFPRCSSCTWPLGETVTRDLVACRVCRARIRRLVRQCQCGSWLTWGRPFARRWTPILLIYPKPLALVLLALDVLTGGPLAAHPAPPCFLSATRPCFLPQPLWLPFLVELRRRPRRRHRGCCGRPGRRLSQMAMDEC